MPLHLSISVTFLNGAFHGRRDAGEPEWPPSPLRLFQALVNACSFDLTDSTVASLEWLARLPPPTISAPPSRPAQAYCLSVPNNAMDKVARAWSRGNTFGEGDANPATHRTMKTIQPVAVDDGLPVTYRWSILDDDRPHAERVATLARRLFALGWGADFIAADGTVSPSTPSTGSSFEVWRPVTNGGDVLRIPNRHTLTALRDRHAAFLNRMSGDRFVPVAPLPGHACERVSYQSDSRPVQPACVAFKFVPTDSTRATMRAFPVQKAAIVAAMLRHAAGQLAERFGLRREQRNAVFGHGEERGLPHVPVASGRLAFLPLPTIEPRDPGCKVSAIRRAVIWCPDNADLSLLDWIRHRLIGASLRDEHTRNDLAILAHLSPGDATLQNYTRRASTWTTVTPVILPGYDDRRPGKSESLIRKSIIQAGYSEELSQHALIDISSAGFIAGADLPRRYCVPKHLSRHSRLHVRITWRSPEGALLKLPGPLALGGGRFTGLGLFAATP
jgi:CRISPR-associated protein Csb2